MLGDYSKRYLDTLDPTGLGQTFAADDQPDDYSSMNDNLPSRDQHNVVDNLKGT